MDVSRHQSVLTISLFLLFQYGQSGETFTSLAHLHRAIDAENELALQIRNYVSKEQERLGSLQWCYRLSLNDQMTFNYDCATI